jgi:hypothetical protein
MASLPEIVSAAPLGPVELPQDLKDKVWFVKYESTDAMVSDTIHDKEWNIQITSNDKLGLTEDHGCIINMKGINRGQVGILPSGETVRGEEIATREGITGRRIPLFNSWDFVIDNLIKTDGPVRRQNLQKTVEQQRADSEQSLAASIERAFSKGMGQAKPDPSDINAYLRSLSPDQRQAMIVMADDEAEGQTDLLAVSGGSKKGK